MRQHIDRRGTACILKLQIRDEDLTYIMFLSSFIATADVMYHIRDAPRIRAEIEHDMSWKKKQCARRYFL